MKPQRTLALGRPGLLVGLSFCLAWTVFLWSGISAAGWGPGAVLGTRAEMVTGAHAASAGGKTVVAALPQAATRRSASIPAGTVDLVLEPTTLSVERNQVFQVVIEARAGSTEVDGVQVYLNFDPARYQVVNSGGTPVTEVEHGVFPTPIQNQVDNAQGKIDYAAVTLGEALTGDITVARFYLKVRADATGGLSRVTFNRSGVRESQVTGGGGSVLDELVEGEYTITGVPTATPTATTTATPAADSSHIYLPLLRKPG